MGCSYHAYAIIGLKLDRDKLFTTKTVPAFEHSYPSHFKIDPVSGKQLWRTERSCVLAPDEEEWCDMKVGSYQLVDNGEDRQERRQYYLGLKADEDDYRSSKNNFLKLGDGQISSVYNDLKAFLEPLGLWDPNAFGLWAVQYVSC